MNIKLSTMKKLIFFSIGIITSLVMTAQVQLIDLNVMPLLSSAVSDTDSVHVLIQFKISDPANVQNINFLFDTIPDNGGVFNGNATVFQQGTDYYTSFNGRQEKIPNHNSRIYCKMSTEQYGIWQHLTVFATISGGGSTNHLYQIR